MHERNKEIDKNLFTFARQHIGRLAYRVAIAYVKASDSSVGIPRIPSIDAPWLSGAAISSQAQADLAAYREAKTV